MRKLVYRKRLCDFVTVFNFIETCQFEMRKFVHIYQVLVGRSEWFAMALYGVASNGRPAINDDDLLVQMGICVFTILYTLHFIYFPEHRSGNTIILQYSILSTILWLVFRTPIHSQHKARLINLNPCTSFVSNSKQRLHCR